MVSTAVVLMVYAIIWVTSRYFIVFRLRGILVVLLLCLGVAVRAQYDPSFSHYFDMEPSYNPAAVGKQSQLNVTAAYALDFVGYEHNPQTAFIGADLPFYAFRVYQGAGVQLVNDKIGLFTHQKLALQYALQTRLLGGQLRVGLQAGFLSENFDGSKVDVDDTDDPAFSTSDVNGSAFDLGVGLYYTHRQWYTGLSVQHATAPTVELGETNELQIDRTYYLTGGYNIALRNPFLTIKSSMLVRTDGVAWRADVTGRLVYQHEKKMLYGGIGYSPAHSVTVLVGGSFHGIVLGYSYEVYTSAVSVGNGSHELYIGYQHDINLVKKGRNLHKSPRIL